LRGHTSKDCWTREENKDKRPKNWRKPSKEKAIIAVKSKKNENIVKYGWANQDLETTLMDPNIWIANTGATVNSTSNVKLAQDWRQETNNTVFVMGNGQKEEVTKTGKVTGIVMFLPNSQYCSMLRGQSQFFDLF
jgi:mRNA degradation ribonuclease J1/J2